MIGSLQSGHICFASAGSCVEVPSSFFSPSDFKTMLAYKSPIEVSVDFAGVVFAVIPASGLRAGTNSTRVRFSPEPKARL